MKNKLIIIVTAILFPFTTNAGFLDNLSNKDCLKSGNCELSDMVDTIGLFITKMVGIMGAVALMYFVWGAIRWLISGGRPTEVTKGRSIMIGTVTAVIIALLAGVFIKFYTEGLFKVKG